MLSIDHEQAQRFIKLLHGNTEQPQCWQVFHDSKTTVDALKKQETFHAKVEDCTEYFNQIQAHNYGVYVTLNKTDGTGREEHNIVGYRTIFADIDNMEMPKLPLQPHLITQRDSTHSHCFWFVKGIVTVDQFKRYQKQVAIKLGSDEQVIDPSRVVRVAGTYNLKDPANPAMYNIVQDYTQLVGRDHTYSLEEIDKAFALTGDDLARLDKWCNSRSSFDSGEGFNDDPRYHQQLVNLVSRAEPAIEGSGTMTLIKVAGYGYDLGVRLEECQSIMWEVYNPRCLPVWEEHEHRHFNQVIERAYKYANNAAGCKTTIGKFSALRAVEPLPEPTGGWEADAERGRLAMSGGKKTAPVVAAVDNPDDVTIEDCNEMDENQIKIQIGSMIAATNSNGAILDMARLFIMGNYPNGKLMRSQKQFYAYNGKCWEETSDENIKSQIMHWFAKSPFDGWKLAPAKINNIYVTIEQIVHVEKLENETWLDGKDHSSSTNIFNNYIVEVVDGEVVTQQHTHKYFALNMRNYNHDFSDECPVFLGLLQSLWDDNVKLKMSLQQFFGYCLTSDTSHHKMALFVGKSRGGKSLIADALAHVIGEENVMSPALETLCDNSIKHSMVRKKLINIPEATQVSPHKQHSVLGILKSASGGDLISFHQLYKGEASGRVTGKMLLTANTMPSFVDESGALANRFLSFPFIKSFFGKEDKSLPAKLAAERAGIFNWAIEGLKQLIAQGYFTEAEASIEMVEDMKRDFFPLADFCDDVCEINNDAQITSNELYKAYQYHCSQRDLHHLSHIKFTKHLKSSYLPITHGRMKSVGKQVRGFYGIRINAEYAVKLSLTSENGKVVNFKPVSEIIPVVRPLNG